MICSCCVSACSKCPCGTAAPSPHNCRRCRRCAAQLPQSPRRAQRTAPTHPPRTVAACHPTRQPRQSSKRGFVSACPCGTVAAQPPLPLRNQPALLPPPPRNCRNRRGAAAAPRRARRTAPHPPTSYRVPRATRPDNRVKVPSGGAPTSKPRPRRPAHVVIRPGGLAPGPGPPLSDPPPLAPASISGSTKPCRCPSVSC